MRLTPGDQANQRMVDRLIAEGSLWSRPLIAAFRATPRHRFLDRVHQFLRRQNRWREIDVGNADADLLRLVYSDRALITRLSSEFAPGTAAPVSSSSQPSLMAQMLEDLKLGAGLNILEIGTGTGYNAALMAHVAGPGQVTTVDVDGDVLAAARRHLAEYSERGIAVVHADGRQKVVGASQVDRLIVTAATADLEPSWFEQLASRGLLLAPFVLAPGLAYVIRGSISDGLFHGRLTRAAYFMPLRAEREIGPSDIISAVPGGDLRVIPAPWAGWFDRRRTRRQWIGFSQALAFFGFLRGCEVHYQTEGLGSAMHGISRDEAVCWYGLHEWHMNSDSACNLGREVWRGFLDAGGPWPTEFRLKANPFSPPEPGHRESFARRGPRCYHLWELLEPRDRPMWI